MSYIWPLDQSITISQLFGAFPGGYNPVGGHTGMDFASPTGTAVRAPGDGVIEYARTFHTTNGSDNPYWLTAGGGLSVVLNAGATAPSFVMSHLSRSLVREGQHVKKGDIIAYTGNSGTWTTGAHLHFEALPPGFNLNSTTYGRVNPGNYCTSYFSGVTTPPAANQRRSGPYVVKQRSQPKLNAPVVREIAPSSLEVFRGYVTNGDEVSIDGKKSRVWYVDQHGYASALLFDPMHQNGLPDLTPKAVKPAGDPVAKNQRVTGKDGAQGRKTADKNGEAVGERFLPDRILTFKGYVRAGVPPYPGTTNIWFVSISGWFFWAGVFEDQGTHDLPDLTPKVTPLPAPAVPVAPAYSFKADIPVINGITVEAIPAHSSNVEIGNFPKLPTMVVDHHWQAPPVSIQSVIGEFQRKDSYKSANLIISDTRIIQMVKFGDRPYHAGPQGNVHIGFEIDPRGYEKDASGKYTATALKIQANVRAAHAAVNAFYKSELGGILHKNVPGNNTACSPFDLATLLPVKAAPAPAPVKPPATPAPAPVAPAPAKPPVAPVEADSGNDKETLDEFTDWMVDQFLKRDKK